MSKNKRLTRIAHTLALLVSISVFPPLSFAQDNMLKAVCQSNFWWAVVDDHRQHYSQQGLAYLGITLGFNAILANTHLDQSIQSRYQQHVRSKTTDELSKKIDQFSTIKQLTVMLPTYLTTMWISQTVNLPVTHSAGHWANRSLRTLLLGAPQQAVFTEFLGAGRPNQKHNSHWHFFKHNRAVSGHAFYGAVPLINAAMVSDSLKTKVLFYGLSALPALSRVNLNRHYLSQASLGWSLAYIAARSVNLTENKQKLNRMQFTVQPIHLGWSVGLHYEF